MEQPPSWTSLGPQLTSARPKRRQHRPQLRRPPPQPLQQQPQRHLRRPRRQCPRGHQGSRVAPVPGRALPPRPAPAPPPRPRRKPLRECEVMTPLSSTCVISLTASPWTTLMNPVWDPQYDWRKSTSLYNWNQLIDSFRRCVPRTVTSIHASLGVNSSQRYKIASLWYLIRFWESLDFIVSQNKKD